MQESDSRWANFSIRVNPVRDMPGRFSVSFRQRRGSARKPGQPHAELPPPDATVIVQWRDNGSQVMSVESSGRDIGIPPQDVQDEACKRVNTLGTWVRRVTDLVERVAEWSQELGWSTRRIEKTLEDSQIGSHQLPALLMQDGTCRMLLEPVGRRAPGVGGVVDLYLMPAYDDIATLFYYDDRWNLHYPFPGAPSAATVRESLGIPLSKEALNKVVEEMKQHAV